MPKGKRGVSISVERQSGSVEFLSKYSKLYALQNGLLIPLKKVTFSGGTWYTINICKRELLENSSAAESKVVIRINESNVNGNCIVVFICEDLEKAEVEYYQSIAEISKDDPVVAKYLETHPNASYEVRRAYITADGTVYRVDEFWMITEELGTASKPSDGRDHYCWEILWYSPKVPHVVYVYVDKDSYEIVLVEEAW